MNWSRVLIHDLRRGILRWRYLMVAIVFALPCISLFNDATKLELQITWFDYIINYFVGVEPISNISEIGNHKIPIAWLLILGSSLFLSLDYFIGDLTREGHHIIIRCTKRAGWYLSKCVCNIFSSMLFFGVGIFTALLFTLLFSGELSLNNTPKVTQFLLNFSQEVTISGEDALLVVIIIPLITIVAVNLIQMTLCLFVKPIYSYLLCISLLVLSTSYQSPLIVGNGAMVIRSSLVNKSGIEIGSVILFTLLIIAASVLVGLFRFRRFDILNLEE